jgi:hypothetical protein
MRRFLFIAVAAAAVAHLALADEPGPQKEKGSTLSATNQMKVDIILRPQFYLQASDLTVVDEGLVNSYSRLSSATVTNNSDFPLRIVEATVSYHDADDALIGRLPVTLTGTIKPHSSFTFTTTNTSFGPKSTLTTDKAKGKSKRADLHIEKVELAD